MTNGEFYKEKIKKIEKSKIGISIINNKPVECEVQCNLCKRNIQIGFCSDLKLIEWYNSEYIPPKPKLTKRQKAFCECFIGYWLVRQPDGVLQLFNWIPDKIENGEWVEKDGDPIKSMKFFNEMFPEFDFIKTEDEPINLYHILKLGECNV